MFSSALIQRKKILCKWFRKTLFYFDFVKFLLIHMHITKRYVLSDQYLSNKCRKILYHHFVFPEDVLLFVFALVTADNIENSPPYHELHITIIKEGVLMMCISCTIHFFMILIIPSVSTSTTLKNQSKHNCNHFNIIFFGSKQINFGYAMNACITLLNLRQKYTINCVRYISYNCILIV